MNTFVESEYDSFEMKREIKLREFIYPSIISNTLELQNIAVTLFVTQVENRDLEIVLFVGYQSPTSSTEIQELFIKFNGTELTRIERLLSHNNSVACYITLEELKKICDAQIAEIRIKNKGGHTDFSSNTIKYGACAIYNALIDENAYVEEIQSWKNEIAEKDRIAEQELSEVIARENRIKNRGVNNFFSVEYDKFKQKLTVEQNKEIELETLDGTLIVLKPKISFRYVRVGDTMPILLMDLDAISKTDLNLKNGECLLILDDKKRLTLHPEENYSKPYLEKYTIESERYEIDEDSLLAICNASVIEMRITNGEGYADISTLDLQLAARRFYNAVIDDTAYSDDLLTHEEREAAERERIRKENEAKEAEEARIRAEKRAEWWAANKKKVGIAFLVIIASIGILVTIIKVSNTVAKNRDKGTVQQNEKIDYSSVGRRADASYDNIQSVLISLSANGSKSGNPYRLASLFTETVNPYVKEGNSKNSQDIPEAMRQFLEIYDYYEVSSPNDLNVQSRGSGYIATYNIIVEWNSERTGHKRACIQKTAYFNNECKLTGFIDQELWRESVSQNSGIRNNSTPSLILDMIGTIGTSQGTLFFNETENRGNYSYSLSNATVKRNLVLDKHVEEKLLLNSYDLSGKYIGKFDGTIKSKGNQISYVGIFTNYKGVSVDFRLRQKGQENHYVNGHWAVDMGLSVRWADCNIGAGAPDEAGNYYAWGETSTKVSFPWNTYKHISNGKLIKYCTNSSSGRVDNKRILETQDDAAYINWGSAWRIPTKEQWEELADNNKCIWEWTTDNGVYGYKVTSKITGNSIFLPTTGYKPGGTRIEHPELGLYWTSTLFTGQYDNGYLAAYRFDLGQTHYNCRGTHRCNGRAIRAVCK